MLPRAHSDRASRSPDGNPGRLEWLGPRSGQSVVAPSQQLHRWFLAAGIMTRVVFGNDPFFNAAAS
jgi:hypothetical protein